MHRLYYFELKVMGAVASKAEHRMREEHLTTSDELEIFKALANENRLLILQWLKHPEQNFPPHKEVQGFDNGVCVAFIQAKLNLSQAATSQYLTMLQKAGLLIATRIGKWTYYRRDEQALARFVDQLKDVI